MASATTGTGPVQTEAMDTQQVGNAVRSQTQGGSFDELVRRCETLDVAHLFTPGIKEQLAIIVAAKKTVHWKKVRKQKLRDRIDSVLSDAEAAQVKMQTAADVDVVRAVRGREGGHL